MTNTKVTVYFVTENGAFAPQFLVDGFVKMLEDKDFELSDIGLGSAYNMPGYLAGEVEEHIDEAVVYCIGFNEEGFRPMIFASEDEIELLLDALNKADDNDNSWEVCSELHKKIRPHRYC